MERRASRFGIRIKFVFMVSTLIVLACLILSVFFIGHEKEVARQILAGQGNDLAMDLAREVEVAGAISSPAALQPLVDRFGEREGVVYCSVEDCNGRILATAGEGISPAGLGQVMTFSCPIVGSGAGGNGERLSMRAVVGVSESEWAERLASLKRAAILLALVVVAIGILATLLVTQITLRPIRELVAATQRIARGELDEPVRIASSGEVRDLCEALNGMAVKLQHSRSKLEEYSRTLEKKVEDRTQELEERVRELSDSRMATLNILEDVKEAKTELERVNQELLALDEMKSKFIGTISHELKTPFTAIKANIDFILSGKEGELPQNLIQYLVTIQRNTNRVRKIMEDFLNVAQIHSGRKHLEPEDLDLAVAVREYLAEMGPIDRKFKVRVDIPSGISVFADPNRLHDVYVNLLLNALKFSPEGGEIRISARPYNGQILSEVSDQGVGIPADKLERIFEEFFQIDRKKYGGTGLGLSIVKGIIHEHGGKIWVDSRPGGGSTFFFTLPTGKGAEDGDIRKSGEGSDC
ncbi:MAG: HAMP domain-containing protein [Deltaproteobacteria bacterium]|nr:HAMP domain-containing protein [Deltaproteobacteria bacterium]